MEAWKAVYGTAQKPVNLTTKGIGNVKMSEYCSLWFHAVIRENPPTIIIFSAHLEGGGGSSLTARSFLTYPLARRDVPVARARAVDSL